MFAKYIIDFPVNLFDQLENSVKFENIVTGRQGANLVTNINNLVPLVRTTTNYTLSNQTFSPVHYDIMNAIKKSSVSNNLEFNNALIEKYNFKYCKMGFHSDQSLDLEENSFICIFSCYNDPNTTNLRKLVINTKNKSNMKTIVLEHNSIVLFSVDTNNKHLHKIILDNNSSAGTSWLGITFRQSKTFISFHNELPYFFPTNKILTLATTEQRKEFYELRNQENLLTDFTYPEINYTISNGDIILNN